MITFFSFTKLRPRLTVQTSLVMEKRVCEKYGPAFEILNLEWGHDIERQKLISALGELCGIYYDPKNIRNPYRIESSIKENAEFKVLISPDIKYQDPDIKARINELDWIFNKNAHSAIRAIRAYLVSALVNFDTRNWTYCVERFERSLKLARLLNKQDARRTIIRHIRDRILIVNGQDDLWLSFKLLEIYYANAAEVDARVVNVHMNAAKLAVQGRSFDRGEKLWLLLSNSSSKSGNAKLSRFALLQAARSLKAQAMWRRRHDQNSNAAASFMQEAIFLLLKARIKGKLRDRWYFRLRQYQEESVSEFAKFETKIDLSKSVEAVLEQMNVATPLEAIKAFISLYTPPDLDRSEKYVRQAISQNPLSNMFAKITYDHRAKIQSATEGYHLAETLSYEDIRPEMIKHQNQIQLLTGDSMVHTAIREIVKNHNIDYYAVEALVRRGAFIAESQSTLATEIICAAFNGNFTSLLYVGIPLLENAIRNMLYANGASVFAQKEKQRVQSEWTLDYMLSLDLSAKIFTKEVVFDISSLLTDESGVKIRHNLAHGLLPDYYTMNTGFTRYFFLLFSFLTLAQGFRPNDNDA